MSVLPSCLRRQPAQPRRPKSLRSQENFRKSEKRRLDYDAMGRSLSFGRFRLDLDTDTLIGDAGRSRLAAVAGAYCVRSSMRGADVVSKAALMDAVWPGLAVEESNLTVQVAALRRDPRR